MLRFLFFDYSFCSSWRDPPSQPASLSTLSSLFISLHCYILSSDIICCVTLTDGIWLFSVAVFSLLDMCRPLSAFALTLICATRVQRRKISCDSFSTISMWSSFPSEMSFSCHAFVCLFLFVSCLWRIDSHSKLPLVYCCLCIMLPRLVCPSLLNPLPPVLSFSA